MTLLCEQQNAAKPFLISLRTEGAEEDLIWAMWKERPALSTYLISRALPNARRATYDSLWRGQSECHHEGRSFGEDIWSWDELREPCRHSTTIDRQLRTASPDRFGDTPRMTRSNCLRIRCAAVLPSLLMAHSLKHNHCFSAIRLQSTLNKAYARLSCCVAPRCGQVDRDTTSHKEGRS